MSTGQPDHPATIPLAVLLNDIRNGKVSGSPRAMAQRVISMVMEGEVEKWAGVDSVYEGGMVDASGEVESCGFTKGTHRRKITAYFTEWEEGSPVEANKRLGTHPLGLTNQPIPGALDNQRALDDLKQRFTAEWNAHKDSL